MKFLNPWGFLYGGVIIVIILLYMLKPRHTQLVVSSTYLWDKTLKDMEASRPWQKLKNNILMILQILIAILLVLAIARPYIAATSIHSDMVVLLDCSASMQADDVAPTRFEKAKGEVLKLVDGMMPDQRMAIVSMGSNGEIIAEATGDKAILRRLIEDMEPENGGGGEDEALSIASALASNLKEAQVIIYSDTQFSIDSDNYHSVVINGDGENTAIESLTYSVQGGEIIALSKINSFGYEGDLTLECYADQKLIDVKEASIESGQVLDIYWRGIPKDTKAIKVSIDTDDNLALDNEAFAVIEGEAFYKALLISEGNVFLERALEQYRGLELTKTTPAQIEELGGYDLYILDGVEVKELPKDGHMIVLDPKANTKFLDIHGDGEFTPGDILPTRAVLANELLQFTHLDDVYIGRGVVIPAPKWAETILRSGDNPLLLAGERDNSKIALFSFDIHRSDLPLKPDFPILMQNILGWMLPGGGALVEDLYAGEEAQVTPMPTAKHIDVIGPDGKSYTGGTLQELGVYKVVQDTDRGEYVDYFAVNFPVHTQSNLKLQKTEQDMDIETTGDRVMTRELWKYILWGVLALLLLEWWVYSYGY